MYSLDPNLNTAVDRQAQKVRNVQAYGTSPKAGRAAQDWETSDTPHGAWPVGRIVGALAMAAVVVGIVVVYVAR
jgi:hypothetical protein